MTNEKRDAAICHAIDRLTALTKEDFHGYRSEVWGVLGLVYDKGMARGILPVAPAPSARGESGEKAVRTYEIFGPNYSEIVQAKSLLGALAASSIAYDEIVMLEDVAMRERNNRVEDTELSRPPQAAEVTDDEIDTEAQRRFKYLSNEAEYNIFYDGAEWMRKVIRSRSGRGGVK